MRLKKYNDFLKEDVDDNNLHSELEIEGMTDNEILLVNKLKEISLKSNVEDDHYIFFKTPVKIGSRSGKDVLCNYFYVYDNSYYNMNYLVFHILYNEKPSEFYDKEWDFGLMNYFEIKRGVHNQRKMNKSGQFGKPMNYKFQFDKDFLEKLYNETLKLDNDWIKKCDEVRQESRDWARLCHKGKPIISWERDLYHSKCQIFYHKILDNQEDIPSIKELKEMEELGEVEYNKKMEKQNKMMRKLMAEWEEERKDKK